VTVTADDFGFATPINEAVEIAHRDGILGAASLMVGGEAAADAVERARRLPTLRVGLHVVVVDGRPVLPRAAVPDLVDAEGRFDSRLLRAGFRFFFLPRVRRQLHAEIRAQCAAFRATGLRLDHVNGHRHMHLHPTVLSAILAAARDDTVIPAVRVPAEPLSAARGTSAGRYLAALARTVLLAPWLALMRWRLRRAGVRSNRYVLGLSDSGAMTEDVWLRLLAHLPAGATEIYCHPATSTASPVPLPMPVGRHVAELHALCSARVRAALER
jgi:hopanoid biosynthesis associated protein HpnK